MEKTNDRLDHLTQHFMVAAILTAAALTLLGMVLQFIFPQAQALVTQLSYYAYGWAVFLSLGPTIKRRMFLRIDLVACRYPKPLQAALRLAGDGILLLLMALLCVLSIRDLLSSISSGAVSPSALQASARRMRASVYLFPAALFTISSNGMSAKRFMRFASPSPPP